MNRPLRPWLITFPGGSKPPYSIRVTEHPYYWAQFTYRWYKLMWLTRGNRTRVTNSLVRKQPPAHFVRLSRNGHVIQIRPWSHHAEVR